MTVQGHFEELRQKFNLSNISNRISAEQMLVIPMQVMGYVTKSSGFLTNLSTDVSNYQEFDASLFIAPNRDWQPPYPYCIDDVLFPVEHRSNQASSTSKTEVQIMSEELLYNDSLGG